MASIIQRGDSWQALVCRKGPGGQTVRRSSTHRTKSEARAWGVQIEADILSGRLGQVPNKTFGEILARYADEVSPGKRGARWEQIRLRALASDPIASVRLSDLDQQHFAAWRDRRLRVVQAETVRREWTLLSCACTVAVREWRWLTTHPMVGVKRPERGRPRDRLIGADELARLLFALGYVRGVAPATKTARVGAALLFAVEIGMRCGEICALRWSDVQLDKRICQVRDETAGAGKTSAARREVPLWPEALRILRELPVAGESVFGLTTASVDALFRKAKAKSAVEGVTFHDSRHTAITRLARLPGMDVLSLARIIGHRDLKQLLIYFNPRAEDLVRLGEK